MRRVYACCMPRAQAARGAAALLCACVSIQAQVSFYPPIHPSSLGVASMLNLDAFPPQQGNKASKPPPKPSEPPLWQELVPIVRAVRQIPDLINRSEALAALSVIALQGGCTEQGQRLWKEAVNTTGKIENEEERGFAQQSIALRLAQGGQFDAALQVAKPIPDPLMRATALGEIARRAAQQKQIDQARHAVEQLGDGRERCEALVAIGVALHQPASPAAPQTQLGSTAADTSPAQAPASPAVEAIAKAQQAAQELAGFDRVVTLAVVSAGWRRLGATEQAQAAQDAAMEAARELDALSREQALHEAANRTAEYGMVESVEPFLKQLPPERQDAPRVILIETLARQGQLDAAQSLFTQVRDAKKRARAATTLALHLVAQDKLEAAEGLLASVPVSVERIQIEVACADALTQRGQNDAASQRLQQAETTARQLSDSRHTPEALGIVAAGYLRRGETEKADALFKEALSRAQSLGEPWTSALLAKIWLHKADAVAARVKQQSTKP